MGPFFFIVSSDLYLYTKNIDFYWLTLCLTEFSHCLYAFFYWLLWVFQIKTSLNMVMDLPSPFQFLYFYFFISWLILLNNSVTIGIFVLSVTLVGMHAMYVSALIFMPFFGWHGWWMYGQRCRYIYYFKEVSINSHFN